MVRPPHTIALILALTLPLTATAQRGDLLSRTDITLRAGGMNYIGDLNNQSMFGTVHPAFGGGLKVTIDNRWSLRIEGAYGSVSCMDDWLPKRNLSFRSPITEGALMIEFNFRPYGVGATESQWTPYIFAGIDLFHFDPQALYIDPRGDSSWVALHDLHTEGQGTTAYPDRQPYTLTQLAVPFGVGLKLRINKNISFSAEYGFRRTWTDYLDDVSTTYVGADLLRDEVDNGAIAAQMADRSATPNLAGVKRGDDSLNDWYSYFNISIGINMEMLFGWTRSKRCRN